MEEPYFKGNSKRNRRSQINSGKNDNDHNDCNRPPPEPPPINSQTGKIITRKNIVECCDQLTIDDLIEIVPCFIDMVALCPIEKLDVKNDV